MHTFTPNTVTESAKVNANFTGLADGSEIIDKALLPRHVSDSLGAGWLPLGEAPDTFTYNGNRNYTLVFNSTDLTDTLSEGMRLQLTRTVSAPTQCADLEASSSQSFSVNNAAGFATGTTWTFKAKIKPESYGAMTIVAYDDGTNRIELRLNSSGQIIVAGGTTASEDLVTSYQSVALGKWQDVTGSITIGTPTGEIRLDDVVVASFVTASAATTMTISGDEEVYIGRNAAGNYFDGKICQVAIFNAIISDATLKTYSGQTMSGSETNCEGFWSLNGVLTDGSANGNTLTANNGATTTTLDSPFGKYLGGTLEYGIVASKPTFSTDTTVVVQVPEGCAIPTSGGVSAVSYSTQGVPYGFPKDEGQWKIQCLGKSGYTTGTLTIATGASLNRKLTIPIGLWEVGYSSIVQLNGSAATQEYETFLSTSTTAVFDELSCMAYSSSNAGYTSTPMSRQTDMKVTTQTEYLLGVVYNQGSGTTTAQMNENRASTVIYAKFNLL